MDREGFLQKGKKNHFLSMTTELNEKAVDFLSLVSK